MTRCYVLLLERFGGDPAARGRSSLSTRETEPLGWRWRQARPKHRSRPTGRSPLSPAKQALREAGGGRLLHFVSARERRARVHLHALPAWYRAARRGGLRARLRAARGGRAAGPREGLDPRGPGPRPLPLRPLRARRG